METTYKGTIYYKMKADHPDIKYIDPMFKNNVFKFEDTYKFKSYLDQDYISKYMSRDLALVAGGGYSTKHIYNISFTIERID